MKIGGYFETIVTKHLIAVILLVVAITIGIYAIILALKLTSINALATFIDIIFKTIAIFVGAIWTLNRYYVGRVDVNQLKVDAEVSVIPAKSFAGNSSNLSLLIYRIDVVNTGKSLIPEFSQFLEIHSVAPVSDGVRYESLCRWPREGSHLGGSIEPGSWSAINNAISIPSEVKAVRFYLEFRLPDENLWNWHKTFDISHREQLSTTEAQPDNSLNPTPR